MLHSGVLKVDDEQITINQSSLNYEEKKEHTIGIRISTSTEILERMFTIEIEDENEPPYDLTCSNETGCCTAFDDDLNQTLKFELGQNLFNYNWNILSNGILIYTYNKDKNETTNQIQVICTDDGSPPLSASIWITLVPNIVAAAADEVTLVLFVVDPNNNNNTMDKKVSTKNLVTLHWDGDEPERQRRQANTPPEDIYFNMFYLTVPENSRDFDIANIYVIDAENDNYTCSMVTLNVPDDHQPFEIVDGILRTSLTMHNNNYDLDFETTPVYNITVTCVDPIHLYSITKNFSIMVSDVNEAPVELTIIPDTLPENSPEGYVIGQFHTVDPDQVPVNQTFEYSIAADPNHLFAVKDDTLILTRANDVEMCIFEPDLCPHDFEQKSSLLVRIRVEDFGEPPASNKFWLEIKLTDENDPPVNLQLDNSVVYENAPIGTLIGSFSDQDQDLYQTQTYDILKELPIVPGGNLFYLDGNNLRLAKAADFEEMQYKIISVRATDNGTIPKSVTQDFIIEILDVNEPPMTYAFLSSTVGLIPNSTIEDLLTKKQPPKTNFLPQNDYLQPILGRIVFLMEDRDQILNLNGSDLAVNNEIAFSTPVCEPLSQNSRFSICSSNIAVVNRSPLDEINNDGDGHLIATSLMLTSNNQTTTFPTPLRIKFENITLTIDNINTDSIDIPNKNSGGIPIGILGAVDLTADGQSISNVTLNPNSSLTYPLELTNSNILKVRDDVNLSSIDLPHSFNVSVLVTLNGEDRRIIEKQLIVNIIDKANVSVALSNNKLMENSQENTPVGELLIKNGVGNYTFALLDDANGRFILNGTTLLVAQKYIEHCHQNHTCAFNYESEPLINVTVAVYDPTNNQILRNLTFPIEILNENEPPYNLTLTTQSIPENTPVGSIVGFVHADEDDFNQTLNYTTDHRSFTIINNQLILTAPLSYDKQQFLPIFIRATDNGLPPTFTEKMFVLNVIPINRPPIKVTTLPGSPIMVAVPQNSSNRSIIGQIRIIDPDLRENFTITFNTPNLRVLMPPTHSYSLISDNGSVVNSYVYNVSLLDMTPLDGQEKVDYLINVTATITDSGNNSVAHQFFVHYISVPAINSTQMSMVTSTPITTPSMAQALHIRIYETTPGGTPLVNGRLSDLSSNCTAHDDQGESFPIGHTNVSSTFNILLPNNYSLNATIRPTFIIAVQCKINNDANVDQEIVVDVLSAPLPIQIGFNQTMPFYASNNLTNGTVLGTFFSIDSGDRTYNLSLTNNRDIFQLLPNGSVIQIGPYPSDFLQFDNPTIDLNVEAVETTPNEPTRTTRRTFRVPIIVIPTNISEPHITFNQSSLSNATNPNSTIGQFIVHNPPGSYQLQLVDSYDHGLTLDSDSGVLILKRPVNTFPLMNNRTQLPVTVALMNNGTNDTILTTTFPLTIVYRAEITVDPCLNVTCGNGTCLITNGSSSYCLCTLGFTGSNCQQIDFCASNPCTHQGVCHLTSSSGFTCQCPSNRTGSRCEYFADACKNITSCPPLSVCIPLANNDANPSTCIPEDELSYFVFDFLTGQKSIDVVDDSTLSDRVQAFFDTNVMPMATNETFVIPETKRLGPYKYDRAQLMSLGVLDSNGRSATSTLTSIIDDFCANQSANADSFGREMCAGFQQALNLNRYFESTPSFCPNCTFVEAADKFYWFDKTISLLPLWLTFIIASLLVAVMPFIPIGGGGDGQKKVAIPLMKAQTNPEDEDEEQEEQMISARSVRVVAEAAASLSQRRPRERNDSGYESTEENNKNYLEQVVFAYQQQQQAFHVYPLLHEPRSPQLTSIQTHDRRATIAAEPIPPSIVITRSDSVSGSRRYARRSASMSAQKYRRQSSPSGHTLKPIIRRRSTLIGSSLDSLIRLTGTPRLHDDKTYVSTTFRNEDTSKFLIGTLWNTFALVNNLFLQRSRRRRDALTGSTNIEADQLARLQALYSLAEMNQIGETTHPGLESVVLQILLQSDKPKTTNLTSLVDEMISSNRSPPASSQCKCYDNRHIASCPFYDDSVPYFKPLILHTSRRQSIVDDGTSTKPPVHDVSTQSWEEKPTRIFTHVKPTNNVSTQSSPVFIWSRQYQHASTQYSPRTTNENIIYDRRVSLMKELKETMSNMQIQTKENETSPTKVNSSHTVRSLVSMFETSDKMPVFPRRKSSPDLKRIIPSSDTATTLLNIGSEETQLSLVDHDIEQYANDLASHIVDNAVLTATTTIVYQSDQPSSRFSSYVNGGHAESYVSSSTLLVDSHPTVSKLPPVEPRHTLIVGRHVDGDTRRSTTKSTKRRSVTTHTDTRRESSSALSSNEEEDEDQYQQFLSSSQLVSAQDLYVRPWLARRATSPNIHCHDLNIGDTRIQPTPTFLGTFAIDANHDIYTRYACLVTIGFYLRAINDRNSHPILFDELNRLQKQFTSADYRESSPPKIHSNVFETINRDGSKRYRTGVIVDINNSPRILSKQIEWRRVKVIVRRFRRKYRRLRHTRREGERGDIQRAEFDLYTRQFDSTSRRRMKKYAQHYAEKI